MDGNKDWAALVTEFMDAQGHEVPEVPLGYLPADVSILRVRLMMEELTEYIVEINGPARPDIVADSLCDLLYTVVGTAVAHGMGPQLDQLFREVARSNMTKDFRSIGQGTKGGFKGRSYEAPNLVPILNS